MLEAEAWALLGRAPAVTLSSVAPDGLPIARALHGVIEGGALLFHGGPKGEKSSLIGREAVVTAHELVAEIPSYFVDPQRACPATTLYESVELRGPVERVEEPARKARALQALMERYQREGGHAPIEIDAPEYDRLYRKAVDGVVITRVRPRSIVGKRKLGQERPAARILAILEGLWRRGRSGDARALERIRDAHPERPTPAFLRAPGGLELRCALAADDPGALAQAVALVEGQYWNVGVDPRRIADAHRGASAWVGVRDGARLVATARAVSDGGKHAWVYDVAVDPEYRARGLGAATLRLLLAHPAVRTVSAVHLKTRDAQRFYARFGFVEVAPQVMSLRRDDARGGPAEPAVAGPRSLERV